MTGCLQKRVNAHLKNNEYPNHLKCKVLFMNSFFYPKIVNSGDYDYKSVRRWTKKRTVSSYLICHFIKPIYI